MSIYTIVIILMATFVVTMIVHAWLLDRAAEHEAARYDALPADDDWHARLADGADDPEFWTTVADLGYLPPGAPIWDAER